MRSLCWLYVPSNFWQNSYEVTLPCIPKMFYIFYMIRAVSKKNKLARTTSNLPPQPELHISFSMQSVS
jgi:hypothetical protein